MFSLIPLDDIKPSVDDDGTVRIGGRRVEGIGLDENGEVDYVNYPMVTDDDGMVGDVDMRLTENRWRWHFIYDNVGIT